MERHRKKFNSYGKLEYKGEYFYGLKRGKGKEYYENCELKFEGEFFNDEEFIGIHYNIKGDIEYKLNFIDGKIKKYNKNDELLDEDVYINGEEKELNTFGQLIFQGEHLNGLRNGRGKEYNNFSGKLIYEGEYLNGKRHGFGYEYNADGKLLFEGIFLNGKKWKGKGYFFNYIAYELNNGNGKAMDYYNNGKLEFEGEYLNGKRNGKGKEYDDFDGRLIFEGEYLNDKRHGKGKDNKDGELIYEGEI